MQKKKKILFAPLIAIFFLLVSISCSELENNKHSKTEVDSLKLDYSSHKLPTDIKWITNNTDPIFASPKAKKGGTYYSFIRSFPLTFRTVGPDSNTVTRSMFMNNQMHLIGYHPNTGRLIPLLATHWAYDKDGKTMYFKINKNARWSDGVPVTADDFIFTLEFMRSKYIKAPWYNDNFTIFFDKIIKYDEKTFSISTPKTVPDLWFHLEMQPRPMHFYKQIDENYVKDYNWKIEPNVGPYFLEKFSKGKYLIFKRKKDWWAKDLRYFKNRFNVDRIKYIVIRDMNVAYEYFKKGKIDTFEATRPTMWHTKAKGKIFDNGYVHKICFYNEIKQPTTGLYLNLDKEIFKDINIRRALAHAINFTKLNKQVLRGDFERLHSIFTGFGEWTNKKIRARKFNIMKVEMYMKKSGWQRGNDGIWIREGLRFSVLITYGNPDLTPRIVILKEEAKKAGIEFRLELLDYSAAYKKQMEKKHEVMFGGFASSPNLRPEPWQAFHSDNAHKSQTNNITNTDDPEMDRLIDAYRTSMKAKERIKYIHKIQKRVHDICAWIPLYQVPYVRHLYWRWIKLPKVPGASKSVQLFEPYEPWDNKYGGLFWIDEKVKKETLNAMNKGISFQPVTIIDRTYKNR